MTLEQCLQQSRKVLKDSVGDTPYVDSVMILCHVLDCEKEKVYKNFDQEISKEDQNKFFHLIEKRKKGEPVAYIVKKKSFYEDDFYISRGVFIPRPETEMIVDKILQNISLKKEGNYKFVDVGCGSGCLGLTLLKKIKDSQALLVDKSSIALKISKENSQKIGVKNRSFFLQASLTLDIPPHWPKAFYPVDFIVSNPPYLSHQDESVEFQVKTFEPQEALFSPDEGRKTLFEWCRLAHTLLKKEGIYCFEMGHDQRKNIEEFFEQTKYFSFYKSFKDYSGKDRVMFCVK